MGHLTLRDEAYGALYYNGATWVAKRANRALVTLYEALDVKLSFPEAKYVPEFRV